MPRIRGRNIRPEVFRFRPGHKAVWLPNFVIALRHTPRLPPNWAMFDVPRTFNKLDLKDYLWHAYGVPALRVRAFLRAPAAQFGERPHRPNERTWWRPRASKHMIVQMAPGPRGGDFVWPEPPEDMKPWDKEMHKAREQEQEQEMRDRAQHIPSNIDQARREGQLVAEQAQAVREAGRRAWKPTWQDFGRQDAATRPGGGPRVSTFDMGKYQRQTQQQTATRG